MLFATEEGSNPCRNTNYPSKQTVSRFPVCIGNSNHNDGNVILSTSLICQFRQFPAGRFRIIPVDDVPDFFSGYFSAEAVAAQDNNVIRKAWGFHDICVHFRPDANCPGKDMCQFAAGKPAF